MILVPLMRRHYGMSLIPDLGHVNQGVAIRDISE
jgi:hypothetical protein